ncbi:5-oxoprolinase subunit PxpB [Flavobacterium sp. MAHUQ-51]|uniref:5-oxoprolinase subunit PxpB n=1 Tax=Flavobacterium sp. GCM10022190 TaxID=3252639 RepID=UPI00361CC315
MNQEFQIYSLGEQSLTIELGKKIDLNIYQKVTALQGLIKSLAIQGITEMVPSYCTLTIHYDPYTVKNYLPISPESISQRFSNYLQQIIGNWNPEILENTTSDLIEIPVCYDPKYGLDLEEMALYHNTTVSKIIELHTATIYSVFMVGFLPGFPYLGILPESLATPRKKQPRLKMPAGAVAIGGNQTGIYPIESPGGWNIIGQTPLKIFDKKRSNPFLLQAGNQVKFVPISVEEFENYKP